ncbi:MAG: YdcH family protein [Kordiimonas sp.]
MDEDSILEKIAILSEEHRDLDGAITAVQQSGSFDLLQVQRMKKRKLLLKDEIEKLQSMLVPDIIA